MVCELKKLSVCHVPVALAPEKGEVEGLLTWEFKFHINYKTL